MSPRMVVRRAGGQPYSAGLLVIRSGFIPRLLGVLLMLAGAAYLIDSFTALVVPQLDPLVSRFTMPLQMGELPIVLWLVIRGARATPAPQRGP